MLPSDDFLRHLPQSIPAIERLRVETLIFAHDLMETALGRLYAVGLEFRENDNASRLSMFGDAWTIVGQVHVVRQVLSSLTGDGRKADTQAFINDFAAGYTMRNKMDHLNQNIPNRARTVGRTNALFGMLTFFRPYADRWERGLQDGEIRGDLFVVTAGSTQGDMIGRVAFDGLDIHLPICSFKLEAFNENLFLERAVFQLRALLGRMSQDVKCQVEALNVTQENLMIQPGSGHFVIRMDFGFPVERPTRTEPGS